MNTDALLALIGDLYAQLRVANDRADAAERDRDMWKQMAEAVAPDEFKATE